MIKTLLVSLSLIWVTHVSSMAQDMISHLRLAEAALLADPANVSHSDYLQASNLGVTQLIADPSKRSLTNTTPNMDPFLGRLLAIWASKAENPGHFEMVGPFFEKGSPDAIMRMVISAHRTGSDNAAYVKLFPVELMHPEIRESVKTHPDFYDQFVQLRIETLARANQSIQNGQMSFRSLEPRFVSRFEEIVGPYRNDPIMIPHLQKLMTAAQIPNLGGIAPGNPRLDSTYVPAWEELVLRVSDIQYKQVLLSLLTPMATEDSAPSLGMVLKQGILGYKANQKDRNCFLLMIQVLDSFRDAPSVKAAVALAEAKTLASSSPNAFDLPIGTRLTLNGWPDLLDRMSGDSQLRTVVDDLKQIEK